MPERSSPSRVRCAAPQTGAPWTAAGRSGGTADTTGGSGGKTTAEGVPHSDDLSAIHRPFLAEKGTALGSLTSSCATQAVSRPAGSHKFNLRGRPLAVPANGCLVTLTRWPNPRWIAKGKSAHNVTYLLWPFRELFGVPGKFCFPLTSSYHGCPIFPPSLSSSSLSRRATPAVICFLRGRVNESL